jgi:acetyl esterase/lipase
MPATQLYGLAIHKYHYDRVIYRTNTLLIDECVQMVQILEYTINNEIQQQESSNDDKLYELVVSFSEQVHLLQAELEQLRNVMINCSLCTNVNIDETDLIHYNLECRGVFLTLLHLMNECLSLFSDMQTKRSSFCLRPSFSRIKSSLYKRLQKRYKKLIAMKSMITMCFIMINDRRMRRRMDKSVETRGYDFPFCDSLKFSNHSELMNIDTGDFLVHIGTQFVPYMRIFFKLMVRITASHGEAIKWANVDIFQKMAFVSYNFYYFLNGADAAARCIKYFNEVTAQSGSALWNLQEDTLIRPFTYLGLPYIYASKPCIIPMKIRKIKNRTYMQGNSQQTHIGNIMNQNKNNMEEEITLDNLLHSENNRHQECTFMEIDTPDNELKLKSEGRITLEQFNKQTNLIPDLMKDQMYKSNTVSVRLILPSEIHDNMKLSEISTMAADYPWLSSFVKICYDIKNTVSRPIEQMELLDYDNSSTVILHIHGGGFVAMSSFSHECYLRLWARRSQIPIISVDYRHAPEFRFPVQLEECYNVYRWIIKHSQEFLFGGMPLKRVIITGDSAGGNLALGVTLRAIHDGIRLPDALAITYPATYLSESPSPARIVALIDPLVNLSFLTMCEASMKYEGSLISKKEQSYNAYVSPAVAPDEIFKYFPPTYCNVGALDPLFDDAIYIARRIYSANGGKVKLDIYDGLGHGYLNTVDIVGEAKQAAFNLIDWIVQFLKSSSQTANNTI